MQITLNQDEIVEAINEYVGQQIVLTDDQEIEVDLKAGRGENGFTATLDIRPVRKTRKIGKPPVMRVASHGTEMPVEDTFKTIKVCQTETTDAATTPQKAAAEAKTSKAENQQTEDEAPTRPVSIFQFAKPVE